MTNCDKAVFEMYVLVYIYNNLIFIAIRDSYDWEELVGEGGVPCRADRARPPQKKFTFTGHRRDDTWDN